MKSVRASYECFGRAKEENAAIFFGDETNIQNTANYMRGYAPMGQPPVVKVESVRFKVNMFSAISKAGKPMPGYHERKEADRLSAEAYQRHSSKSVFDFGQS